MPMQPLISAVIIFYQAEAFIEQAITSVLTQSYVNWELLLVDDGSTDASSEIALHYCRKYPQRIRYLEHEGHQNRGMSATRNMGIHHSKGEYIAFLDADDVWLPQKLERQAILLQVNQEAAMVCGPTQYWYSWTGKRRDAALDTTRMVAPRLNALWRPPELATLLLRDRANTPATCSALIRRQAVIELGGFEELFPGMYEDQALFVKLYLKKVVYISEESLDLYRQHPNSHCAAEERAGRFYPSQPSAAQLAFFNWFEAYLNRQRYQDSEIWEALQQALRPYRHPVLYYLLRPLALAMRLARLLIPRKLRHRLWVCWKSGI